MNILIQDVGILPNVELSWKCKLWNLFEAAYIFAKSLQRDKKYIFFIILQ